jgi:hypothetical protein
MTLVDIQSVPFKETLIPRVALLGDCLECSQRPDKQFKGREGLFWLTVAEVLSVHHGREGIAGRAADRKLGGGERERDRERERQTERERQRERERD